MASNKDQTEQFEHLRRQAEELIRQRQYLSYEPPSEILELIHELKVHHAELCIQNEELKQTQHNLTALHCEYNDLYEFAPCGYVTLNAQGIITRANLTASNLLGTQRSILTNSTFTKFVAPGWEYAFLRARKEAEVSGEKRIIELPLQRHGASPVWIRADIDADRDESGLLTQWRMVLVDITDRKRADEALRESEKTYRSIFENTGAATVIVEADSVLARMSHEIRTPMNSILGMINLMFLDDLPGKQRQRALLAKDASESLLWLLSDLLDLSKIEAGRFELYARAFRLDHLLTNVIQEMEPLASGKDLALSLQGQDSVTSHLIGDPYRLRQILINLLNNAIKFTDRGWISLKAQPSYKDPPELGRRAAISIRFEVRDTGKGIHPDKLQAIFESYEQGEPDAFSAELGTGLGLAICRKLCQQKMGGNIWAESEPGKGSAFYVTIPFQVAGEIIDDPASPSEAWPREDLPPLDILLVEDQKMNQIFTVDLLTSHGHRVDVAEDGKQALDKLSQKNFDLVLMDIKMPVMDGIEATNHIRAADSGTLDPGIPIVGLSAHVPSDEEEKRFRKAGFNHYVVKPLTFEKLFFAMKSARDGKDSGSWRERP